MARGKSVRDQTAGYRFQNLGGITVGFEGRLESGLGFEMCRIYEVVAQGGTILNLGFTSWERDGSVLLFGVWLR